MLFEEAVKGRVLLRALNCSQGQYYLELAEKVRLINHLYMVGCEHEYLCSFYFINLIISVIEIWRN